MCQRKSDYTEGWKVVVIDTPDIFSSMSPVEDQCHHIGQCLELSAPILHALLLVIPVGHDRAEDRETMEGIQKAFGAEARRHTLVIFTRGDELEGGSIQDYTNSSEALRRMLANYGYRYCAFNNKADEEERLSQVRELLHTVQRMVEENGGPYRVACGRAGDALQVSVLIKVSQGPCAGRSGKQTGTDKRKVSCASCKGLLIHYPGRGGSGR